jgi:hypothetical protein
MLGVVVVLPAVTIFCFIGINGILVSMGLLIGFPKIKGRISVTFNQITVFGWDYRFLFQC